MLRGPGKVKLGALHCLFTRSRRTLISIMKSADFRQTASTHRPLRLALCGLLAAALLAPVAAVAVAVDGLEPAKAQGFDEAWQKPGTDLGRYTAVLIRPPTVAFSRHWRPRDYGSFGLKPAEVERIRASYAEAAEHAFARVLTKRGLSVATAPGENVLEVQAEILDLYVNGPEITSDVLVRTYVRSAADMRLRLTLRDSASGTVLFRGTDFKRGQETGRLEWANSVYNRMEAEQAFSGWARQLSELLEK
jgi:hypothetical protein